jgi:hypothetical protein
MTLDYTRTWEVLNELEMVTSKICSAREILDSAINALESGNKEKAETLMYAADEFLQYYLEDFDRKFKTAWSETVVKLNESYFANDILTQDRVSNFPGEQYTDEELNAMCDKAEQDQIKFGFDTMNSPSSYYNDDYIHFNIDPAGNDLTGMFSDYGKTTNKVKKWILPVQEMENGDTMENEYFIQLPDDLLEQAGWKENDELNWVDNKDGTFTLTKTNG